VTFNILLTHFLFFAENKISKVSLLHYQQWVLWKVFILWNAK